MLNPVPAVKNTLKKLKNILNISALQSYNFDKKRALIWAGIGAILGGSAGGLAAASTQSVLNKVLYITGGSALGGGAGLGTYILKQRFLQQTGGLYTGKRDYKNLPDVSKNPDGTKYMIYIPGYKGEKTSEYATPNNKIAIFPYGDVQSARSFIKTLKPNDKVIIVGHSLGGTTAIKVAKDQQKRLKSLITLDPTAGNPLDLVEVLLDRRKVNGWFNYYPENYQMDTDANKAKYLYGQLFRNILSEAKNIPVSNDDHALNSLVFKTNPSDKAGLQRVYRQAQRL